MTDSQLFGEFMKEVVNRAERLSLERYGCSFAERYDVPSTIIKMIGSILNTGWDSFKALSELLSNPSYFAFAVAMASFLVTPIGLIVIGALTYWGGTESLRLFYDNRTVVDDIRTIGDKYERYFCESGSDEERHKIIEQAAEEMCEYRK